MKLLCFPYAGGTSEIFLRWGKNIEGLQVIPLDPPGRGRRLAEPLSKSMDEMVEDIKKQIAAEIDPNEAYAVYGHSMGAILAYEVLHSLLDAGFPMPVHAFLSGKNAPHYKMRNTIHQFDDAKLIKEVAKMGGIEAQFFENPTLAKIYLPILRNDITIIETYRCKKKERRLLPIDISYFFSKDDTLIDFSYVKQWADYIEGSFRIYYFMGGHFFMLEHKEEIIGIIQQTLLENQDIIPY
ncbi:MAG: alpha/beta fold hydrolase [Candidatus Azobacteroides sp.]|nr:alpha/beta fold hydrolase [Candidatus Azobacteroides sp.]